MLTYVVVIQMPDTWQRPDLTHAWANALTTMGVLNLTIEPMHPGVDDANMRRFFSIAVPDELNAQMIADTLRANEAVDACYVKPVDAPPTTP